VPAWHVSFFIYCMTGKAELKRQRNTLLLRINRTLEGPMAFLGFVWLALLLVELTRGLSPALQFISVVIWVVFVLDFLLKLVLAPQKLAFVKKNWLTAISLVIPALRIVRFARLFRVVRSLRGVRLVKVVASLNRGMKSLGATMKRRGLKYVVMLTLVVIFGGAAGMYGFEVQHGLKSYGEALWWTAMLITSLGSEYWPQTGEGKTLCLLLALYGFCVFGYITATLASFFVGRDAEEEGAPVAGASDVEELKKLVSSLSAKIDDLKADLNKRKAT
jgi:voltage-gated potassium channel